MFSAQCQGDFSKEFGIVSIKNGGVPLKSEKRRRGSMSYLSVFVKCRVVSKEVCFVKPLLCADKEFSESLVVNDLPCTQEADHVVDVGVIRNAQDVVVGRACLHFWCNHIRTNFSEIPMNFYGNIPCSGDSFADRYVINQRFHDFAVKVFQVCVLFNEFAAVITNRNFVVDFG